MLHGAVQAGVDFQHFTLTAAERFGRRFAIHAHRPFQFGVACAHLLLVGALGVPQAVGGRGLADGFAYIKRFGQGVDLRFEQAGNRADVHAAVAVFGEKAHAEIFHFVAGAGHQKAVDLAVVIKCDHAQARARVGQRQLFGGEIGFVYIGGGGKLLKRGG